MKIPSCTIELGPNSDVLPQYKDAGVDALYNLLIFTNMLQQEGNENKPPQYRKITKVPVVHTDVPYRYTYQGFVLIACRYLEYPQAPASGLLDWVKFPGDFFSVGDVLAKIRNLEGEVVGTITSELDGYMIGMQYCSGLTSSLLGWNYRL